MDHNTWYLERITDTKINEIETLSPMAYKNYNRSRYLVRRMLTFHVVGHTFATTIKMYQFNKCLYTYSK